MSADQEVTEQELLNDAVRSTEQSIMDHALADEPPADEADEEPVADDQVDAEPSETAKAEGANRDPKTGQFVAKDKAAAGDQQQDGSRQGDDTQAPEGENDVPRWRLREMAEERRQAQARAQTLETELARMRGQLEQLQRAQQPQPKEMKAAEPIDPLLDPQGFANQVRSGFDQRMQEIQLNHSMEIAHLRHGETFEKAYAELLKQAQGGNSQLVRQLTSQPNPGEAVVRWHKQETLLKATNGDLTKYDQSVEERLLNDPEFRKRAVEKWTGQGGGSSQRQQGNRPNTITQIPPSLSRQAGSSANIDPIDTDDSERAVFDYALK